MEIKPGAQLAGLDIDMRPVLIAADRIWRQHGRPEGVTVTSGLDGRHSAGSWHYYGRALDLRTRYWDLDTRRRVADLLRDALPPAYTVGLEPDHIHVELPYG